MALTPFNKFHAFVEALAEKKHNLGADVLKVYLTNVLPNAATHAVKADLAEIAAGNGNPAGGKVCALQSSSQSGGLYRLVLGDPPVWTASGATMATFRYAVLYNDTALNDDLIGWWDYPGPVSLLVSEQFAIDLDATNGVLTIQ